MIPTRRVLIPIVEDGKLIGDMPTDLSELCVTCARWTANLQCRAFPDIIPEAIRSGKHDHREPFEGDGGLRWSPSPNVTSDGGRGPVTPTLRRVAGRLKLDLPDDEIVY